MRTEEIVARFDDRPGMAIVDYVEIGLPVYRLTCTALMQVQKRYPPIEEFVLRCLGVGLRQPTEMAGMLGLSRGVVEATLTNLIQNDDVFERYDGSVELTTKGQGAAREHVAIRPMEENIVFFVDGLTRKPQWIDQRELLFPKQADAAGLKQIRAFPARRPKTSELDVADVYAAIRIGGGAREASRQLLRIKAVRRADRMFMPALLLIYKAMRLPDVQVAFLIDGRLSSEHEEAFLAGKGLEKLRIRELVKREESDHVRDLMGEELASEIEGRVQRSLEVTESIKKKEAVARLKASITRDKVMKETRREVASLSNDDQPGVISEIEKVDTNVKMIAVRPLAVYEHPRLLRNAISTARERLVIISPWVTPAVVDRELLQRLDQTLGRGIRVYIGYGLGEDSKGREENNAAIEGLERLERQHDGFTLKRFGDTHAKVLIKDREFFVTTSFNWLSFRGDSNRTFREEYGTFVGIEEKVEEFFATIVARFG